AAELLGSRDIVESALNDPRSAAISSKLAALLAFIGKVTEASAQIEERDVARVREAGWSDEAIYDAITVCALFNFYNRWVNASGVADMPAAAYEISGKRMAADGYIREE